MAALTPSGGGGWGGAPSWGSRGLAGTASATLGPPARAASWHAAHTRRREDDPTPPTPSERARSPTQTRGASAHGARVESPRSRPGGVEGCEEAVGR
eukprot:scaffold9196_cov110-Isochrysis_galbana.AAC.14